jgi:hypothetical protein
VDILQCRSCWQVAAAPITMVLSHTARTPAACRDVLDDDSRASVSRDVSL